MRSLVSVVQEAAAASCSGRQGGGGRRLGGAPGETMGEGRGGGGGGCNADSALFRANGGQEEGSRMNNAEPEAGLGAGADGRQSPPEVSEESMRAG